MRLSTATPFSIVLVLTSFIQAISALTLTDLQPIHGFDTACTNAYNTPLTDCSNSDFSGQGCSAKCIGFLDSLTKTLNDVCAGTIVYPNTLIGLFFDSEGVQTLCSNAGGSSSSRGSGIAYGQSGGQGGAYGIQSAAGEASTSTTSTSSFTTSTSSTPQAAAMSSTPEAAAPSSTPQAAATSSTTTIIPTTVTPEPTTTSVAVVGTTVTPESPSDASTSTSLTKSSTSSSSSSTSTSTSSGKGEGTLLDIGSSACHDAAVSAWMFGLLAGSAGVAWLL